MKGEIVGTSDNHDGATSSLAPEQLLRASLPTSDKRIGAGAGIDCVNRNSRAL
jgi:hypothetical protein